MTSLSIWWATQNPQVTFTLSSRSLVSRMRYAMWTCVCTRMRNTTPVWQEKRLMLSRRRLFCNQDMVCFIYTIAPWFGMECFMHYWPFVRGIHQWPVDSYQEGPVMRKVFSMLSSIIYNRFHGRLEARAFSITYIVRLWKLIGNYYILLARYGLVTPSGNMDLGHHWLKQCLVAWQYPTINIGLSSVRSIHLRIPQPPITKISLNITCLKRR